MMSKLFVGRSLVVSAGLAAICGLFLAVHAVHNHQEDQRLAACAQTIDGSVVQALLTQDWKTVANQVDVSPASAPVTRLLKGHAYLALNRNNEAIGQFRSLATENERQAWDTWSQWFLRAHSDVAMAHYLRGDALARQGKREEALASFSQAVKLDPQNPLFLNARAVTYAAQKQFDPALLDMEDAVRQKGQLADVFASRGIVSLESLHSQEGAKSALADFNQALDISPDYGPALVGRGCAEYILGERPQALRDFQQASASLPWLQPICKYNIDMAAALAGGDRRLAFL
jgi:tetratricopeptide (TPR) repeat protein